MENSEEILLPILSIQDAVKVKTEGEDETKDGVVTGMNLDGTYRVQFHDGAEVGNVRREFLEPMEDLEESHESEETSIVAGDIDRSDWQLL
eukprot:758060-Hanusia_phi.AAC.2